MTATVDELAADLRRLGVRPGDLLMVHASMRAIGPVEGGADVVEFGTAWMAKHLSNA